MLGVRYKSIFAPKRARAHQISEPRETEAGSHLRLIDSCITQLKAQGPFMTCDGSKEEGLRQS